MIFSPIRIILMAIGAAVGLAVVLAVVVLAAAFAGDPGDCDSGGRLVESSPALADQLQAKLDGLQAQLDAGQASSITFDESEATSRGSRFLDEENAPIAGLKICLNPDGASASGSLEAVLGLDVTAKVSGDIFLDGEHPRVEDVDIDVGAVPGFAAGGFEGAVEDVINDQLEHISLDHQFTITFGEGTATLSGQP